MDIRTKEGWLHLFDILDQYNSQNIRLSMDYGRQAYSRSCVICILEDIGKAQIWSCMVCCLDRIRLYATQVNRNILEQNQYFCKGSSVKGDG